MPTIPVRSIDLRLSTAGAVALILGALGSVLPAFAAEVPATEPPRQVEVITITAEKREENLQTAPVAAIVLQAVWASLLIITGTFGTLFTFVSVIITLFAALTVGSVIVLRWKRPELKRPYKLWGYPLVPIVFILAHLWIVWGSLTHKPVESLWGLVIVSLGIPAYLFWRGRAVQG